MEGEEASMMITYKLEVRKGVHVLLSPLLKPPLGVSGDRRSKSICEEDPLSIT